MDAETPEERVRRLLAAVIRSGKIEASTIEGLVNDLPSLYSREVDIQVPPIEGTLNLQVSPDTRIITRVGFPSKKFVDVGDKVISRNGDRVEDNIEILTTGHNRQGCTLRVQTGIRPGGTMRLQSYLPEAYTALDPSHACKAYKPGTWNRRLWLATLPAQMLTNFRYEEHKSPLLFELALTLSDDLIFGNAEWTLNQEDSFDQKLNVYKAAHVGMGVLNLEGTVLNIAEMFSGRDFYGEPRNGIVLIRLRSDLWQDGVRFVLYSPRSHVIFPDMHGGISALGRGMREKAEFIIHGRDVEQNFTNMKNNFFSKIHEKLNSNKSNDRTKIIEGFTWLYFQ